MGLSRFLVPGAGAALVDSLQWKADARVRSAVNVNLAAPGANVDGVAMVAGQSFLAAGQTAPAENGIYVWNGPAVPATRRGDANVATELVNATLTIEEGSTPGTTWRQTTPTPITLGVTALAFAPFGSGDVVGPGTATDNAFVRMDGTTGKLIQNSVATLSDTGVAAFGDGAIGAPAVSFTAELTSGLTRLGAGILAAAVLGLEVVRFVAPGGVNPQVLHPAGTNALPSISFAGDPDSGVYSAGANNVAVAAGGTAVAAFQSSLVSFPSGYRLEAASTNGVLILGGQQTTSANGPFAFQNQQVFTGAGVDQTGVRIIGGVNQTTTASWSGLQFEVGLANSGVGGAPVFGSGGGFFINAKVNGTAIYQVTTAGRAYMGDGTAALPSMSFATLTTMGFYKYDSNNLGLAIAGVARVAFAASSITALTANTTYYIAGAVSGSAVQSLRLTNNAAFSGGAGIAQVGVLIDSTINQTSTAAFTSLDIVRTETALGSGAQYAINVKVGAGGATQVFAVTAAGAVQTYDGTTSIVAQSYVGEVNTGWNRSGAGTIMYVSAGTQYWALSSAITAQVNGQQIKSGVANGSIAASGNATTGAVANWIFTNGNSYTATSTVTQLGVQLTHTINQAASSADFTSLQIIRTETSLGSGSHYFINAKGGAAGGTQLFAVTNLGYVQSGDGTAAAPSHSFVNAPTAGFYGGSATTVNLALSGAQKIQFAFSTSNVYIQLGAASGQLNVLGGLSGGSILNLSGQANGANEALRIDNTAVFSGAGTNQLGTKIAYGINQTTTSSFVALTIDMGLAATGIGGAPVFGSGGGLFMNMRSNGTAVAQITNAGAVLATGTVANPGFAFTGDTTSGAYLISSGQIGFASGGALQVRVVNVGMWFENNKGITCSGVGSVFYGAQNTTGATAGAIRMGNFTTAFGYATATGGAGIAQVGLLEEWCVNQTSTASYVGHRINMLGASGSGAPTFGSGGGLAFDIQANSVSLYSVNAVGGGVANKFVSPTTLASGTTNDYAGAAGYSFARITANAANSTLSGISATNVPDGFQLCIINISASATLTISNAGAGSAAANRVLTISGADVVLAAKAVMYLIYDLTSATWRQI